MSPVLLGHCSLFRKTFVSHLETLVDILKCRMGNSYMNLTPFKMNEFILIYNSWIRLQRNN